MVRALFVVVSLVVAPCAQDAGAFRVASLFGDHMVLPAARAVPVHGSGAPGRTVRVAPSWGEPVETTVPGDGRWQLTLPVAARGTEGELVLSCGDAPGFVAAPFRAEIR